MLQNLDHRLLQLRCQILKDHGGGQREISMYMYCWEEVPWFVCNLIAVSRSALLGSFMLVDYISCLQMDAVGVDGEEIQIAMPSKSEVNDLVLASENEYKTRLGNCPFQLVGCNEVFQ